VTETVHETRVELEVGYASGKSVPRKEDRRLVQGEGVFADDVKRHGMG
jgi:CO/xanthine dehydrogenase Mo-binding subunit